MPYERGTRKVVRRRLAMLLTKNSGAKRRLASLVGLAPTPGDDQLEAVGGGTDASHDVERTPLPLAEANR